MNEIGYEKSKYRFSVFTPCYNSSKFIHRVIESLEQQTFKDFEWIVINDASTDDTDSVLKKYIENAPFDIQYFNLSKNQMVTANYNLAIKKAKGELFVALGHDDKMLPHSLQRFNEIWEEHSNKEISAIYSLAEDQNGQLVGNKYEKDVMVSDFFTVFYAQQNVGEKFQCFKTEILRKYYPEFEHWVKKGIPAGWLWSQVGCDYKAIFINDVMRIYYRETENTGALSKVSRNRYPHWAFNYGQFFINKFQYHIKNNLFIRYKMILSYISYGRIAGNSLKDILSPIDSFINKLIIFVSFPIVILIDKIRGI